MLWFDLVNIAFLVLIWLMIGIHFSSIAHDRKYWLIFFAIYTITEMISLPLAAKGINNLWLYNISKPIQFLMLLKYFSVILKLEKKKTYAMVIIGAACCVFLFSSGDLNSYKSLQEVILGACITTLCVLYFYRVIRSDEPVDLPSSEFWYCSALFIFYGTALAINGSLDYLITHHISVARKLFYGLVISSWFLYAMNLYAMILNYQLKAKRHG